MGALAAAEAAAAALMAARSGGVEGGGGDAGSVAVRIDRIARRRARRLRLEDSEDVSWTRRRRRRDLD